MLENPQVATDLIYNYRGMKIPGTRNEAGWNSVYVTGKIIKKIGPILAIKNDEFKTPYVSKKLTKNSRLKKYLDKRSVNEQQEDKKGIHFLCN